MNLCFKNVIGVRIRVDLSAFVWGRQPGEPGAAEEPFARGRAGHRGQTK